MALSAGSSHAATTSGAVISNGTVQLGVNAQGSLNYDCTGAADTDCPAPTTETDVVGLRFQSLNLESTAPGCVCEGWGVADAGSGLTGFANEDSGDGNITVDSFEVPAPDHAISTVTISDPAIPGYQMQVVQDYRPSPFTPNLFNDTVTITNTGSNPITDLRYRRVMDWDVEPTPFEEWVTSKGNTAQLLFNSDDGFDTSDPLAGPSYISSEAVCGTDYLGVCEFVDLGEGGTYPTVSEPADQGGLYDFGLGTLAPNESKKVTVSYGAAPSEADALAALEAGGAQVYSLGQSSCSGETVETCDPGGTGNAGVELGKPATFMFAFVTATADLAITKSDSPDPAVVGEDLTYSISVQNNGPDPGRAVRVVDQLPEGVEFVSATPDQGSCSGTSTVTCNLGSVPNGASTKVTIVVRPIRPGAFSNTATVSTVSDDPNGSNNSATADTDVAAKAPRIVRCDIPITGVDLKGDDRKNTLSGTPLGDRLRGGGGDDRLKGAEVADCLRGDAGNDKITGDGGNDVIRGGADKDDIAGGKGDDDIRAQNGNDTVSGGPGDDTIKAQARGFDVVECGTGKDSVIGDVKDTIADDCEKVRIVDPA